jgi:aurora kinase
LLSIDDEIKLTDFGWSIHVSNPNKRRKTYCGTPDYICPEIALHKDYDFRLDLWCLGVLTYEFAAGFAPFSECFDRKDMVRKIRELEFDYPSHFSPELKDFVRALLKTNPQDRMSLKEAENHPWITKYYFEPMKKQADEQ